MPALSGTHNVSGYKSNIKWAHLRPAYGRAQNLPVFRKAKLFEKRGVLVFWRLKAPKHQASHFILLLYPETMPRTFPAGVCGQRPLAGQSPAWAGCACQTPARNMPGNKNNNSKSHPCAIIYQHQKLIP